jgi:hypothetical protein
MVPEDLLSVNNLGTNFKLSIKGSGSAVISFVKAWKTYVKENIYKYAYHEKRNLQYAIYAIYKYAHDENIKYNINQMYI